MTSGKFFSSKQTEKAVEAIATLLKAEFDDLECDRNVLAAWRENPEITPDELAEQMQRTRHVVSTSLVRLLSRDLIEVPANK
jgi:predicted transcriptional regulator